MTLVRYGALMSTNSHIRSSRVMIDGSLQAAEVALDPDGIVVAVHPDAGGAQNVDGDAVIDLGDQPVYPAPLDLHFHGCGGVSVPPAGSVAELDAQLEQLTQRVEAWQPSSSALAHLPVRSVPGYLATLPVPGDLGSGVVDHIARAAQHIASTGSTLCEGLRLEGGFINPRRAGVWPPESFLAPDAGLLREIVAAAADHGVPLRIVDIAPELPGALELVAVARELGVIAAIAHSDATYEEAMRGFDAGITIATHLLNAMTGLHHRAPGVVGAVLDHPHAAIELICDAIHVHPAAARIACRAVGAERVVLVSDASPFAGQPSGTYTWNGMTIHADGRTLTNRDGALAGSHAVLADVAREDALGPALREWNVASMCSVTPRTVLDPDRSRGVQVGDRLWIANESMCGAAAADPQ